MHIAMIGQKGVPSQGGGIEKHVEELSTRLMRLGHTVTAYARYWYGDKTAKTFNGMRVVFLPSLYTKHLDTITHTFFATLHACFIARADVIHYHGVGPSLLAFLPRFLSPNAVVITTFHCIDRTHGKWGSFARFMLGLGERAAVRFSHGTIVVSKTLKNYVALTFGERATYLPNGVSAQRVATNQVLLSPFGLQNFQYVAMVARLVPHKSQHVLIEAWKKAVAMRPDIFAGKKLAIVGGSAFTDGYVEELKLSALGDDSIVFTGTARGDSLSALFAGAKFLVHTSESEGLPIAVLEGMSFGKAVLASDIPEHKEAVMDHGVTFATGNAHDLAAKLLMLMSDDMLAASLGHAARTFVEMEYNWDDIARETVCLYDTHRALHAGVLALR